MRSKKIYPFILMFIVTFLCLLIYVNDMLISPETKVKRVLNNIEELPVETQDKIQNFYDQIEQLEKERYEYGQNYLRSTKKIYKVSSLFSNDTDEAVSVDYTMMLSDRVWGMGFILFELNKRNFLNQWDIVDVKLLPIEEGRTGFKYPDDFTLQNKFDY